MVDELKSTGVSKQRLDALTDGVYAFAMTLLVISLDLPSGDQVSNTDQLLALLGQLQDNLLVYVISFTVLGARWLRNARDHGSDGWCSNGYAWAVIVHLFFVTLTPFATKLVGLYGDLWPAICLYAAVTVFAALSSRRAAELLAAQETPGKAVGGQVRSHGSDRHRTAVLCASLRGAALQHVCLSAQRGEPVPAAHLASRLGALVQRSVSPPSMVMISPVVKLAAPDAR